MRLDWLRSSNQCPTRAFLFPPISVLLFCGQTFIYKHYGLILEEKIGVHPEMSDFRFLYLAVEEHSFKIGISTNPGQRLAKLKAKLDYEQSIQVRSTGRGVNRLEKMLHFMFDQFRVEHPTSDGHTEWFSRDCLQQVKQFIEENKVYLKWTAIEPIPDPHPNSPVPESQLLSPLCEMVVQEYMAWFRQLEEFGHLTGRWETKEHSYLVLRNGGDELYREMVKWSLHYHCSDPGFYGPFQGGTFVSSSPYHLIPVNDLFLRDELKSVHLLRLRDYIQQKTNEVPRDVVPTLEQILEELALRRKDLMSALAQALEGSV